MHTHKHTKMREIALTCMQHMHNQADRPLHLWKNNSIKVHALDSNPLHTQKYIPQHKQTQKMLVRETCDNFSQKWANLARICCSLCISCGLMFFCIGYCSTKSLILVYLKYRRSCNTFQRCGWELLEKGTCTRDIRVSFLVMSLLGKWRAYTCV
jgi:hypothetical protein